MCVNVSRGRFSWWHRSGVIGCQIPPKNDNTHLAFSHMCLLEPMQGASGAGYYRLARKGILNFISYSMICFKL